MIRSFLKEHIWLLAVLMLTLVVMFPSLSNDFVNWDDEVYIHDNEMVHGFSIPHIREAFSTQQVHGAYTPLTQISWSIDYSIGGMDASVYHLHNLLLHLINVILIYFVVINLLKNKSIALIVALLFAIHPIHVEPVVWISSRKDVLFGMYFLGALLAYLKFRQQPENRNLLILTFVLFVMSLLSKGAAITLPFVLLLVDYLQKRQSTKMVWLEKVPFLVMTVIFSYLAYTGQQEIGAIESAHEGSNLDSVLFGGYGFLVYLIKAFVPFEITNYYPYPSGSPGAVFYIFSAISLLLTILAFVYRNKNRALFFAFMFFAITVAPVLQIISFGATMMADRFVYIPYAGLFMGIAWLVIKLWDLANKKKPVLMGIAVLITGTFAYMSFARTKVWQDGETLWTDAIKHNPDNHEVYGHRANYLQSVGRVDEAKKDYDRSIALNSNYSFALNNRGLIYMHSDMLDSAFADFDAAIKSNGFDAAYLNRGIIYARLKEYDKALADFDVASKAMKDDRLLFYNRGSVYYMIRDNRALSDLETAKKLGLNDPRLYRMLGNLYYEQRQLEAAEDNFRNCVQLNPNDSECLHGLALSLFERGEYNEAISYLDRVIELNPQYSNAYTDRGLLYLNKGEYEPAIQDFNNAISLDSTAFQAWYNKALALKLQGNNLADAERAISSVIRQRPDLLSALAERAEIRFRRNDTEGAKKDIMLYASLTEKDESTTQRMQALCDSLNLEINF